MSIDIINDYGPGDNNFTSFQETLDATRRGMAEITLSNYDNDSAPDVKVGSVFENNGAFFQVTTSDITPTGYSGISNSTTFFLYYDESATAFIYSATAPTWNDARQGWYNGDDRAFFSMFKDSGGTLYQEKYLLENQSSSNVTKNKIYMTGPIEYQQNYYASGATGATIYSELSTWVADGEAISVKGEIKGVSPATGTRFILGMAVFTSSNLIRVTYASYGTSPAIGNITLTNTDSNTYDVVVYANETVGL